MSRFFLKVGRSFALLAALVCLHTPAQAQIHNHAPKYFFQTLYDFNSFNDLNGYGPEAAMVMDSNGNLYGTTQYGGAFPGPNGPGTIFQYSPATNTFTTLYKFTGGNDGFYPTGLIMDSGGNLYGPATGGVNSNGTIFKYAPDTNTFTTLYTFSAFTGTNYNSDGAGPSGLLMDSSGNLYGTANQGGANGVGTIFEYAPSTNTFTTLLSFTGGNDGAYPSGGLFLDGSGLIMDGSGNLYGTAFLGGANGYGTIFRYSPGATIVSTLYSFSADPNNDGNSDGAEPNTGVIMDSSGNLYGTTSEGGSVNGGAGTIFKYAPDTNTFTTLHSFTGGIDGGHPNAGLIMDSGGNLYGTANQGGAYNVANGGYGTVFKYAPDTNTFTTLHSFTGGNDGYYPNAGLIMDSSGNLYGTTGGGGAYLDGTIFMLRPIYITVPPPHGSQGPEFPLFHGGLLYMP